MAEKIMTFRVDEDLKKVFEAACEAKDTTASQVFRNIMREMAAEYQKSGRQKELLSGRKGK